MASTSGVATGAKPAQGRWTGDEWRRRGDAPTTPRGATASGRGARGGGRPPRGGGRGGGRPHNQVAEVSLAGFSPGVPLPPLKAPQPVRPSGLVPAAPQPPATGPAPTRASRRTQRKTSTSTDASGRTDTPPIAHAPDASGSGTGLGPRTTSRRKRNRRSSTASRQSISTKSSIASLSHHSNNHHNLTISVSGPSKETPPHLAGDVPTPLRSSAADINQLVERVRAMAMEHNRPVTPGSASHIDWAGDDDDDSLPDLDDWGVTTSSVDEKAEEMAAPILDVGSVPGMPSFQPEVNVPNSPATPVASKLPTGPRSDGKRQKAPVVELGKERDAPKKSRREKEREKDRQKKLDLPLTLTQVAVVPRDDLISPTTPKAPLLNFSRTVRKEESAPLEPTPSLNDTDGRQVKSEPPVTPTSSLAKIPLPPTLPAKPVAALVAVQQSVRASLPTKPSTATQPANTPSPAPIPTSLDSPAVSLPPSCTKPLTEPKPEAPPAAVQPQVELSQPSESFTTKVALPEPINVERAISDEVKDGPELSPSVSLPGTLSRHAFQRAHARSHTVGRHAAPLQPSTAPPTSFHHSQTSGLLSPTKAPSAHRSKPTTPTGTIHPVHHTPTHARTQSSPVAGSHRRAPSSARPVISVDAIARLTRTLGGGPRREQGAVTAPPSVPATE